MPEVHCDLASYAADGAVAVSGEIENAHPGDCVTATGWPAIVTVPERAGPVVEATTTLTVPFPLPDERPCSEIQPSFETADHSHSAFALTENRRVPPARRPARSRPRHEHPLRLGHNEGLTRDDCSAGSRSVRRSQLRQRSQMPNHSRMPGSRSARRRYSLQSRHVGVVVIAIAPFPPAAGN